MIELAGLGLQRLGWTDFEAKAAAEHPELVPARVVVEHRDRFEIVTADEPWIAELAGRLRTRKKAKDSMEKPAVGDWVLVRPGSPPIIEHLIPRRTSLVRKAAGKQPRPQIVATNVDVVFVVTSVGADVSVRRIERYASLIGESAIDAVVVLSKVDLFPEQVAEDRARIQAVWPGVAIVEASGIAAVGLEPLRARLGPGRTGALIGSSGVGKSTLVNALIGRHLMPTSEVRAGDERGKHTTTARALIPLGERGEGGLLIDSPGMRELAAWDATEGVKSTFEDVEGLAVGCRFSDCGHTNEPGCAVRDVVPSERLEAYRALLAEQAELAKTQRGKGRPRR